MGALRLILIFYRFVVYSAILVACGIYTNGYFNFHDHFIVTKDWVMSFNLWG